MYILIRASLVLNICSSVAWCRPYPRWYFTIFYFQCFPLAGLRLRFSWYVFPQDRKLLGCFFGRWFLIVPCFFFFCLFVLLLWPSRQVRLLFLSTSLLSLGYPSPAPPSLFLTGYFDAQVSVFRYPVFSALVLLPPSVFGCVSLIVFFDALYFPNQPCLTGYLGSRIALCTALLYTCVFTAPLWAGFLGALLFRRPPACCPPIFAHFRAQPVVPARP